MRSLLVLMALLGLALALVSLGLGVPLERMIFWMNRVVGGLVSLICPLYILMVLLAPGIGYRFSAAVQQGWERLKGRRAEITDLKQRIHHLSKPHHMAQLAGIYLRQGRYKLAADWF